MSLPSDIKQVKNNDFIIEMTIKNPDGTLFPITGYNLYFEIKKTYDAVAIVKKNSITSPTEVFIHDSVNSKIRAKVLKTETIGITSGEYYYQLTIVDGAGNAASLVNINGNAGKITFTEQIAVQP